MGNTCIKEVFTKHHEKSTSFALLTNRYNITDNGINLGDEEDLYEALYDMKSTKPGYLSFLKGDKVKVSNKQETVWHGHNLRSNENGYFIAENVEPYDKLKEFPWYFGAMTRNRAEELLLRNGVPGTYIIRISETSESDYTLSLRDDDSIKHYRIKRLQKGGFYILSRCKFADLKILVKHYQKSANGLSKKLENVCPIPSSDPSCDQWEIIRDQIELIKVLGRGNFSEVWEGIWNKTIKVAVKTLKTNSMDTDDTDTDRASILAEATIMKTLSHPKLVRLYAVCSVGEPVYIVMELMLKGDLRKYLQSGPKLSPAELIGISAQIADGMSYLALNNYIHRDLAARNILLENKNSIKIADFGLGKILNCHQTEYIGDENSKIAVKWAAPEVISDKKFSIMSDIWSFGIVMYEVASRGEVPDDVNLVKGKQPKRFPNLLYECMVKCWNIDPSSRPTFKSLNLALIEYET